LKVLSIGVKKIEKNLNLGFLIMKLWTLSVLSLLVFPLTSVHANEQCRESFNLCKAECMKKSYDFSGESKMSCASACGNQQFGCDVAELFPKWAQDGGNSVIDGLNNFLWTIVSPRNCGPNKDTRCKS